MTQKARKANFFVKFDSRESSEKRVSKLKQLFNRARVGTIVKGGRYRKKKLSTRQEREAALMREHYREERERNKFYQ